MDQSSSLCKLEANSDEGCKVTRSIVIHTDLTWLVHVHGKEISHSNSAISNIGERLDVSSLQELVNILDQYNICCGNPEQQFLSLVESKNGSITQQNGVISAYLDKSLPVNDHSSTVRTSSCDIISKTPKCTSCTIVIVTI